MAQRVRAGREDCESATHAALAGIVGHQDWDARVDGGFDEPLGRKSAAEAHVAFRVRGSGLRFATRDHPYRIDLAREHARREMLPGGGHRDSSGADGDSVGFGAALGVHPGSGNVHVDFAGI